MNAMVRQFNGLCGAVMLVLAGSASAATTWTLTTGTVAGVGSNPSVTATSTGWANTGAVLTGSAGGVDNQKLEQQLYNASSNQTHFWLYSGGLGINNNDGCATGSTCDAGDVWSTAPEHAIDNQGRYEMVLVSFSSNVNLTGATYGWTGNQDSGVSGAGSETTVLAYTGSGAPTLAGLTWGTLSGWTKIGDYSNATDNVVKATNAPATTFSSYWLIGAYNSLVSGTAGTLSAGNDYMKLKSVIGTEQRVPPQSVPEPGSLALIVLALVGMLYMRQRRLV